MSEPWENTSRQSLGENWDQPNEKQPVDRTAKYILIAGLTVSFAVVVVGSAIKEAKAVICKIKNRAHSNKK